jgi:hypothetical protein
MANPLTHHHDAFFKQFMSRPELARTFLCEHLPPQVAQLLSSSCLCELQARTWMRSSPSITPTWCFACA